MIFREMVFLFLLSLPNSGSEIQYQIQETMGEIVKGSETNPCLEGFLEKASVLLEITTEDFLVIRDNKSSPESKNFAKEKLKSSLEILESFLDQCGIETFSEDTFESFSFETSVIPYEDSTLGIGNPVPPMDGNWPSAASPIF